MRWPLRTLLSLCPSLPLLAGGVLLAAALTPGGARAEPAALELFTRDADWQGGPYDAFIRQAQMLQARQPGAAPLAVRPVSAMPAGGLPGLRSGAGASGGDIDLSRVRQRSLPPGPGSRPPAAPPPAAAGRAAGAPDRVPVRIAVGPRAARSLLDEAQDGTPLLLALLSRLEYEALRQHPSMSQPRRPIAVLLREPGAAVQLALARALLPGSPRLGVVASADMEPLVAELRRAAGAQPLAIHYAADAASLAQALQDTLGQADALLLLSDRLGNDATAGLTLLHGAAAARKPAIATSEASVRAGALAAAVPTAAQLARQALDIANSAGWRPRHPPYPSVQLHAAGEVSVHVNRSVAARLGLPLPDTGALAAQLHAAHAPRSP